MKFSNTCPTSIQLFFTCLSPLLSPPLPSLL
ncbi:unnamed protein product [Spirodela intermedia]|uniref:Uncharacterized protein n=2 Tax=Spirodela intermedia TaxID=51605 RepID=A0A7I8IJB0_SPIIN|nr:unnamed protein product [Spirodela intermedia]CAA6657966.1 unnamed protein product [Spirodela intermedia]CAA7394097.1 unnamed protein product [Spirodela intermedia]